MAEVEPSRIELPNELLGPRVSLRPYREDDAQQLWEAVDESRAEIGEWLPWVEEYRSPEDALPSARRLAARWLLREDLVVGIFERSTGRLLGGSGLVRNNWRIRSFEIGYWARTSAVGNGYITETVQVLTRFAFDALLANRVHLRVDPRNARSRAIPERLGFVYEGRLRNDSPSRLGEARDTDVFALLPDEFRRLSWAALS